jgi:ubiquinone/menaquinone biosynthesis C-methylase UbiE
MKKILRKIKRIMIKVLGSKTDELYWRFRHFFDISWAESYISEESINSPHRKILIEKMSDFDSILEFGCSSGPNLYLLAQKYPQSKIYGIDISRKAIREGKRFFKKNNIKNVSLISGGIEALAGFKDKSIDVVFSDAVLIYFGKDKIREVIKEMVRIARKEIVLLELHHNAESVYKDNWIHNYVELFSELGLVAEIFKLDSGIWAGNWEESGYIIKVKL